MQGMQLQFRKKHSWMILSGHAEGGLTYIVTSRLEFGMGADTEPD